MPATETADRTAVRTAHDDGIGGGISVDFLGAFTLRVGRTTVRTFRAGRSRALAQYLLANRNQVLSRERLEEEVWPESEDGPAPTSLKVAAHGVRRTLAGAAQLDWRAGGYVLSCDDLDSDVDALQQDHERGTAAARAGRDAEAEALLLRAVDRYRGEFLTGEHAPWVRQRREWVRTTVLSALQAVRALADRRGDVDDVLRRCHQALDIDPYQEHVYGELADVHTRRGEHARARDWSQLCRIRLAEIGVRPTTVS